MSYVSVCVCVYVYVVWIDVYLCGAKMWVGKDDCVDGRGWLDGWKMCQVCPNVCNILFLVTK